MEETESAQSGGNEGAEEVDYVLWNAEITFRKSGGDPTPLEQVVIGLDANIRDYLDLVTTQVGCFTLWRRNQAIVDLRAVCQYGSDSANPSRSMLIISIEEWCRRLALLTPEGFRPAIAGFVYRVQRWTLSGNDLLGMIRHRAALNEGPHD